MANITNTTNATSCISLPIWGFDAIYSTLFGILTIPNNAIVLIVFLRNRHLRTNPFRYYLMNLMVANMFYALIYKPVKIYFILYPFTQHTNAYCSAYIHTTYLSGAFTFASHLLITINRIWAVTFPLSYSRHHSVKTAVAVCVGMWSFICAMLLPGLLFDTISLRDTGDNVNCLIKAEGIPAFRLRRNVIQVMFYIFPGFVILLAYPWIWWKWRQRAIRWDLRRPNPVAVAPQLPRGVDVPGQDANVAAHRHATGSRKMSTSFMVLTLLTITVAICWTPMITFYQVLLFGNMYIPLLNQVGQNLWVIEPVVDPILFSVAFGDLRAELRKCFGID